MLPREGDLSLGLHRLPRENGGAPTIPCQETPEDQAKPCKTAGGKWAFSPPPPPPPPTVLQETLTQPVYYYYYDHFVQRTAGGRRRFPPRNPDAAGFFWRPFIAPSHCREAMLKYWPFRAMSSAWVPCSRQCPLSST